MFISSDARNMSYQTLVNSYYELATLFYEWGWGQSFHFAYQLLGEKFQEAIRRHEYYLAGRLGVSAGKHIFLSRRTKYSNSVVRIVRFLIFKSWKIGDKVFDCGCGIGGPMRNIAKFTNATITGVTLNEVSNLRIIFSFSCSSSL